jgi:hypothetical protein
MITSLPVVTEDKRGLRITSTGTLAVLPNLAVKSQSPSARFGSSRTEMEKKVNETSWYVWG